MKDKDITRIRVGRFDISMIGIKQVMAEMAGTHRGNSDKEIAPVLLERLSRDNYIPDRAREEYALALVREFRKFIGQPYGDEVPHGLEIKVLGMGCSQCNSLEQTVMELLAELGLPANLEHVADIQAIARYGVMGTPALVINSKIVAVGRVPSRNQIKTWLLEAQNALQQV